VDLRNKRITVIGLGLSGTSSAILANYLGAIVFVSDSGANKSIHKNALKLMSLHHIASETGSHTDRIYDAELWIISPGISKNSEIVKKANNKNIKSISEIEFASKYTLNPIIAVTGSNGKTTTCNMLNSMLNGSGVKPILSGNLGVPFSKTVLQQLKNPSKNVYFILEVSSFQLEKIEHFKPNYAVFTNISPDHLDRHDTMSEYIKMKLRLTKNISHNDYIIYNQDDTILNQIFINKNLKKITYSLKKDSNGYSVKNGYIINQNKNKIISTDKLSVPGKHNILNFLAAATCSKLIGIKEEKILDTLKKFKGLEHRLEHVLAKGNITYINDSKSTNIESVICAIESFKNPIILLLGGQNKQSDFRLLLPHIKVSKVKLVITYGESGGHIKTVLGDAVRSELMKDLNSAVRKAHNLAAAGDTILLSPGCASFDEFNNFEERGRFFKNYAKQINSL
tara:strand:- start:2274 stop:3632 length:1359 start_codon:yes stop_codon:yes gene_type:complete